MFIIKSHRKGTYGIFDTEDKSVTNIGKEDLITSIEGVTDETMKRVARREPKKMGDIKIYPCAVKIFSRDNFEPYRKCANIAELRDTAVSRGIKVSEHAGMYKILWEIEKRTRVIK